jgi:hypothetical protein
MVTNINISGNRLRQSLSYFKEMLHMEWIREVPRIDLLFNKIDVFRFKLARVPLTVCFPEYGGKNEIDNGGLVKLARVQSVCFPEYGGNNEIDSGGLESDLELGYVNPYEHEETKRAGRRFIRTKRRQEMFDDLVQGPLQYVKKQFTDVFEAKTRFRRQRLTCRFVVATTQSTDELRR